MVLEGQEGKVAGYLLEDSPVHRVVELPSLDPAFQPGSPSSSPRSCTIFAINKRIKTSALSNRVSNQSGLINSIQCKVGPLQQV